MRITTFACLLLLSACSAGSRTTFPADDGVSLAYTLHQGNTSMPPIILLHMLGRTRTDWDGFAATLNEKGYTTLAFDLRGHGQSGGYLRNQEDYTAFIRDVGAATRFLANQGTPTDRVVIIGASIGANVALNYAATDPRVKAAVLLSPGFDYKGITTNASVTIPLFNAASTEDTYSFQTAQQLSSTTGRTLVTFTGAGHGNAMFQTTDLNKSILDWLDRTIGQS